MADVVNRIGEALNAGRSIDVELRDDQLNRWLTARAEMWPDAQLPSLEPARDPLLSVLAGGVLRVGANAEWHGLAGIVSIECRPSLNGDWISLSSPTSYLGAVPFPTAWVMSQFASRAKTLDGSVRFAPECIQLSAVGVWPNGKRPFRVTQLNVEKGVIRFRMSPEPNLP